MLRRCRVVELLLPPSLCRQCSSSSVVRSTDRVFSRLLVRSLPLLFSSAAMSTEQSDGAVVQPSSAASPIDSATADASSYEQTLVQYIVMRSDLVKQHKWNVGGLIANGSHACVSVLADSWEDADVQRYVTASAGTQMHKVVLAARDEKELTDTASLLRQHSIVHKVWVSAPTAASHAWLLVYRSQHSPRCVARPLCCGCQIEQPEQLPSCLATRPYRRHVLQPILRHLKLFR